VFSINNTYPFSMIVAKVHLMTVVQAINHWVFAAWPRAHSQKTIAARIETTYLPESSAGIEFGYATDHHGNSATCTRSHYRETQRQCYELPGNAISQSPHAAFLFPHAFGSKVALSGLPALKA
jgi:hypothetical protein